MNNTQQHGADPNGQFAQVGAEEGIVARPFTLQEALPYSPQTSTIPLISGQLSPLLDILRLTLVRYHPRPRSRLRLPCAPSD